MPEQCGCCRITAYVHLEEALLPVDVEVHATRVNERTGAQDGPWRMFSEARLRKGTYRYDCVVPTDADDENCAWKVSVTRLESEVEVERQPSYHIAHD
ncbi:MAG TPA: hypothetical protein VJ672_01850 [Gemmatimonadaceae bacterium]|nr:hypothetical protein [Gemmatimonadaceae bacterium]